MRESPIIDPKTGRGFIPRDGEYPGERRERERNPKKQDLTRHITRATTTGIRQASPGHSVASFLTPDRLAAVLRGAIDGDMSDYLILAEEMEERDLHYSSQLRTRKLAVSGLQPMVEAASDESSDIALADEVRDLINDASFSGMLFDLLDGLGKGFSVVEVIWQTTGGRWQPKEYKWVDPRFFQFDLDTGRELRHRDYSVEGGQLEPYKYLIHQPKLKSGLPIRNGLARLAATLYMLKGYTLKDWWAFAEVFGMPIRVGKYGPNATDEEITTLVNAIANIASDAGAAIPDSMKMEFIESAKGNGGDTLFQNMAEWADSQISKGVLGQTMTADNGSSQSQANVHNDVRGDIQRDDAQQLANTVQTMVHWFIDLNRGPQKRYPKITLPIIEPEDLKMLSDALGPMIDRGLKVEQSQVLDRFGFANADKKAELMHPQGSLQPATPALNHQQGQRLALNQQQDDPVDRELADIEADLLNEWQPVIKPITDPIDKLAGDCQDLQEFIARLPELLKDGAMDTQQLVLKLAEGSFKARGLGDATTRDGGSAGNAGVLASDV